MFIHCLCIRDIRIYPVRWGQYHDPSAWCKLSGELTNISSYIRPRWKILSWTCEWTSSNFVVLGNSSSFLRGRENMRDSDDKIYSRAVNLLCKAYKTCHSECWLKFLRVRASATSTRKITEQESDRVLDKKIEYNITSSCLRKKDENIAAQLQNYSLNYWFFKPTGQCV